MVTHTHSPGHHPPTLNGNEMDLWKDMGKNMTGNDEEPPGPPQNPPPHPKWYWRGSFHYRCLVRARSTVLIHWTSLRRPTAQSVSWWLPAGVSHSKSSCHAFITFLIRCSMLLRVEQVWGSMCTRTGWYCSPKTRQNEAHHIQQVCKQGFNMG